MRACHSPGCTDETNLLSASNGVTLRDERATQMEVAGHDAGAVIDVNDISGEKEIRDKSHNTAIRCIYRRADFPCEIHSEMRARQSSIE